MRTILVADDSTTIRRVVEHAFARTGVRVIGATDGEEALRLCREERPDVVLCDVLMPGLSGYEVAEAIASDPALDRTRILLLTGAFEPFDEARSKACGAAGYLTKPFESATLRQRVLALSGGQLPDPPRDLAVAPEPPESAHDAGHGGGDLLLRRWGLDAADTGRRGPSAAPREAAAAPARGPSAAGRPATAPDPDEPLGPLTPEIRPWRPPRVALPGDEDFDLSRPPVPAPPPAATPAVRPPAPPPAAAAAAADPEALRDEIRRQVADLAPEIVRQVVHEVAWEILPDLLDRLLRESAAAGRDPRGRSS